MLWHWYESFLDTPTQSDVRNNSTHPVEHGTSQRLHGKCFGEYVHQHILGRNIMKFNLSLLNMVTYKVMPNVKWCQMSMCLAQEWETRLLANAIHLWLSAWITMAVVCEWSSSWSSVQNHTAFFIAFAEAIYSASLMSKKLIHLQHRRQNLLLICDHPDLVPSWSQFNQQD